MRNAAVIFLFSVILAGCDPMYHLSYCVSNESGKTVYVCTKSKEYGVTKVDTILPGKTDTVTLNIGIGYAKPVYLDDEPDLYNRYFFFVDPSLKDSSMFTPSTDWTYSESKKVNGTAVITVTNSDLPK